jgi:hypothetical protein
MTAKIKFPHARFAPGWGRAEFRVGAEARAALDERGTLTIAQKAQRHEIKGTWPQLNRNWHCEPRSILSITARLGCVGLGSLLLISDISHS